ncbi:MAG: TIGR02186 family protein [Alphaproteobacteria bacterium]
MIRYLAILLCFATWPAIADPLIASLSDHQVSIRPTFTGAEILLFGALGDEAADQRVPSDVVVVVRGPEAPLTVRKKDRVGIIWANTEALEFEKVPGFYAVLSTRPLEEIASASLWARHAIGADNLSLASFVESDEVEVYRRAIIRSRRRDGLFVEEVGAFDVIGGQLFRARLTLPANVPVGAYKVEAFVLRDRKIIGAQFSPLFVDKIGLERRIYKFAQEWPWAYGVVAVLLAIWFGWAAAAIFRRDD